MKIALVNQPWDTINLPVQSGSIPIWNYEVARRLNESCSVIIYSRKNQNQSAVEFFKNVEYRRVSIAADKLFNGVSKLLAKLLSKPNYFASSLYGFGYALGIALDLRKQQCDLVHIHNFSQFVPLIKAFNPNLKVVLHMHCEWLSQLDAKTIARRLSKVDLIVGCSQYITDKIKTCFPQYADRTQTVFNGVDSEDFVGGEHIDRTSSDRDRKIIFVGRISPEKGLHVLLDAFAIVREKHPGVQLEIIGPQKPTPTEFLASLSDDPRVAKLTNFAPEKYFSHLQSKLSENDSGVAFVDAVNHLELVDRYRHADLLINPSLSEAFGMSLVEAMATGIPAIATKVGGMTEIIEDGITGLIAEPDNAPALAEAILQLLRDNQLRESMGKAGRQRVLKLFCWDRVTENLLIEYFQLHNSPNYLPPLLSLYQKISVQVIYRTPI
jgi:glycosyltransferase involved in cell wall biosynthesis